MLEQAKRLNIKGEVSPNFPPIILKFGGNGQKKAFKNVKKQPKMAVFRCLCQSVKMCFFGMCVGQKVALSLYSKKAMFLHLKQPWE